MKERQIKIGGVGRGVGKWSNSQKERVVVICEELSLGILAKVIVWISQFRSVIRQIQLKFKCLSALPYFAFLATTPSKRRCEPKDSPCSGSDFTLLFGLSKVYITLLWRLDHATKTGLSSCRNGRTQRGDTPRKWRPEVQFRKVAEGPEDPSIDISDGSNFQVQCGILRNEKWRKQLDRRVMCLQGRKFRTNGYWMVEERTDKTLVYA